MFILISYIYFVNSCRGLHRLSQRHGTRAQGKGKKGPKSGSLSEGRADLPSFFLCNWGGGGGGVSGFGEDHRIGCLAHNGAHGDSWLQGILSP